MKEFIDPAYTAEESLPLRYFKGIACNGLERDDLIGLHLKEGARIFPLVNYKGVSVYLADESTMMASGTFKTLEACLTMALCRKMGYHKVAFSSGANFGAAMTLYAQKTGIETFFFHPRKTLWKLDGRLFPGPRAHLISVHKPENEVKQAALTFSGLSGVKHVPEKEWRYLATSLRAFFVFEYMQKHCMQFGWISQAVCAGYGPIGFYAKAGQLADEGVWSRDWVPKFLGVQQEAVAPMVRAWEKGHSKILDEDIVAPSEELLAPALYNTNPQASYSILHDQIVRYGGNMIAVNKQEHLVYKPLVLDWLDEAGIHLASIKINGTQRIIEEAGLLGLVGTLKAVDQGLIKEGEKVLAFLTGGAGMHSGEGARPGFEIKQADDLNSSLREYVSRHTALPI